MYIPQQYTPGTVVPFIVGADGPDQLLFTALDNLIAQKRVPVMVAISISNGSGDAQGSQRGLEYDTMSGRYAEFVETEVLPWSRSITTFGTGSPRALRRDAARGRCSHGMRGSATICTIACELLGHFRDHMHLQSADSGGL